MKKFLSMVCAVALAALCAVPAFAEATPGEAVNESVTALAGNIMNAPNKAGKTAEAEQMTSIITANPTNTVAKNQANAAMCVINAVDTEVNRVGKNATVSNYVTFEAPDANNVTVQSLTQQDGNTWVLTASASTQPKMGVLMAVYGLGGGSYQLVYVADDGTEATYDTQVASTNNAIVFWVPHFSTYKIVRVSTVADTAPAAAASATTTVDAAAVDAQFYTCKACGYHNWTGTVGGYKCDHCGHIEAKDLSNYPNVKGTATLPTATSAAASNNIIKATGADMSMVVLAVLALAAALVAGFACIVRKQGLGK